MLTLILISLVAYTVVALLFKAAAPHTQAPGLVLVALAVVSLATAAVMLARGEWGGTWAGAVIALLSGGLFSLGSICRVKALATTPVSLVFAITNLDLVLAGAVALFVPIFGQTLTVWNVLAVALAGAAILFGAQIRGVERIAPSTFLALGILTVSSLGFVSYARFFPAQLLFFILLNHLAGVLLNAPALRTIGRSEIRWGVALGSCMFVGFWTLLQALAGSGESLSLVLLALSTKTPLIALLAVPVFKERMTRAKLTAIGLASLAVIVWEGGPALEQRAGALSWLGGVALGLGAAGLLVAFAVGYGYGRATARRNWRDYLPAPLRSRIVVEVRCDEQTRAPVAIRAEARGRPLAVLMRLHSDTQDHQSYGPERQLPADAGVRAVTLTLPTATARELGVKVTTSAGGDAPADAPLDVEVRGWTRSCRFSLQDQAREIVVPLDTSGNWCWLTLSMPHDAPAQARERAVGAP